MKDFIKFMLESGAVTKLILSALREQGYCFVIRKNNKQQYVELIHGSRLSKSGHEFYAPTRDDLVKLSTNHVIEIQCKEPTHSRLQTVTR